jgi:hypothetical protein
MHPSPILKHRRLHFRDSLPLATSMVGKWTFEELTGDFTDHTGRGNDLTRVGVTGPLAGYNTPSGLGVYLQVGSYSGAKKADAADVRFRGDYTLCFWFNLITTSSTSRFPLVSKGDWAGVLDFELFVGAKSNQISAYQGDGKVTLIPFGTSGFNMPGGWQHLAITKVVGAHAKVLLNGGLPTQSNYTGAWGANNAKPFKMGEEEVPTVGLWSSFEDYALDDCGKWDRVLSQAEIVKVMTTGLP